MTPPPTIDLQAFASVSTMYILLTGEIIESLEAYQRVEERFLWVSRKTIVEKLLRLRHLTDQHKKSVIAIYEDGHHIREFVNVDRAFSPLHFC